MCSEAPLQTSLNQQDLSPSLLWAVWLGSKGWGKRLLCLPGVCRWMGRGMCGLWETWVSESFGERMAQEQRLEASDMFCWLLCKGKQVERARKGTRKESHLQEWPEQRNQMWAPISIMSGLLHNSPTAVLFMCLFLRLIICWFDRGLLHWSLLLGHEQYAWYEMQTSSFGRCRVC